MSLKTQTLINTTGNTVYLVSLWVLTVITTQLLGYEAVGRLTLAMTLGNVFAIIQVYGVRNYQGTDMSFQFTPNDYLRARLITCSGGLLLGVVVCLILGYSGLVISTVFLFQLMKSSETFSDVLFGDDQRQGHLELAGYSMFLRGALIALLFFVGAYCARDLNVALITATIGAWFLSLLVDLTLYRKTINSSNYTVPGKTVELLQHCFPLLIAALLPTAITAVPRLFLEQYYGTEVLGAYGNVSTPALFLTAVTPSILAAFLPHYGRQFNCKDFHGILKTTRLTILCCLILGGICFIGALLIGRWILSFLYTDYIIPYVKYLYPIIITMIIYTLDMCVATTLIAMRESRKVLYAAFVAFIVCFILTIPLVRIYSIGGAIASLAIPYSVQTLIQLVWVLRKCLDSEEE